MPEETIEEVAADTAEEPKNLPAGGSRERVWSESEHDAYVKQRIDKQNSKHASEIADKDARIAELEEQAKNSKAEADELKHREEIREWADKVSAETGIPASILRGQTLEEMQSHAESIKAVMPTYQESHESGKPASQVKMTAAQISEIKSDREMLQAIKDNLL